MSDTITMPVRGMHCAACQGRVQQELERTPGVTTAAVNLLLNSATVTFDSGVTTPARLVEAVRVTGYEAELPVSTSDRGAEEAERDRSSSEEFRSLATKSLASLVRDAFARLAEEGKTPCYAAVNGALAGVLAVADKVRLSSAGAIAGMKRLGLEVIILTGDNRRTAEAVAKAVGVARVAAEVLPEGKIADVGIAMGSATDVATEAGDVVLMRSDLGTVLQAIRLSRRARATMRQNLFWAFIYNVIGIPVVAGALYPAFGVLLSPVLASAAMALSSVSVVTNSLRLRRFS